MSSVRTTYSKGPGRISGSIEIKVVIGLAVVGFGAALFGLGIFHAFQNGSCSTTGYSANYGPVPHCARGTGWWMLLIFGGLIVLGIGTALSEIGGVAGGILFVAIGAPFVGLALRTSKAQLLFGSSASSGKLFAGIFGGCFAVAGLVWAAFALPEVLSDTDHRSLLGGLVASGAGVLGAFAIASGISSGIGTTTPAQVAGQPATVPGAVSTAFTGPTGANVIGSTSPGSLFESSNLTPVIGDLVKRFGSNISITSLSLYPGEIDLIVDKPGGVGQPVRIERNGTITVGGTSTYTTAPTAIYLSQLRANVPQAITHRIATVIHVPVSRLGRMELVTDLPGQNAGWQVYQTTGSQPSFRALLDGSGLKWIGVGAAQLNAATQHTNAAIAGAMSQAEKATKLAACINAAGTDVSKIQACTARYTP